MSVLKCNYSNKEQSLLKELVKGQHPLTCVICCSDSRVIPEKIFDKTFGELFVIRTAGNVINEGELASIEYALEHLKVKEVIVLAHTHCGAIHASIHQEKSKYMDVILNRIYKNISGEINETKASELNAKKEVSYLKDKFNNHQDKFIATIYDIEKLEVRTI